MTPDKTVVYIGTNHTIERACPICHAKLDGLTCMSLARLDGPQAMALGDVTKCAYCGGLLVLTEFGFQIAQQADLGGLPDLLQRVMHEFPSRAERDGKKKPQ